MAKVILICGKICSGKTLYAKSLAKEYNGVILSADEITLSLFGQRLGETHEEIVGKIRRYLLTKTAEIVMTYSNVVLDWGFWTKNDRHEVIKFFDGKHIAIEWHYIDITDETWRKNAAKRNRCVQSGHEDAYFIDENIAEKCLRMFEAPAREEIDVWYNNNW